MLLFEAQVKDNLKMEMKNEVRCGECNRLLGRGIILDLQIKCPRCKTINQFKNQMRNKIPSSDTQDVLLEQKSVKLK